MPDAERTSPVIVPPTSVSSLRASMARQSLWLVIGAAALTGLVALQDLVAGHWPVLAAYFLAAAVGGLCALALGHWRHRLRRSTAQLRDGEERLRLILEHSSDGINMARFDPDSRARQLVWCNDKYVQMSGRSREELMAAADLNTFVTYPEAAENLPRWRRSMRAGKPYTGQASWIRPDGKENYYEWTAAPVTFGDKLFLIGVDRDITERKEAEQRIRHLQNELAHVTRIGTVGEIAAGLAHELNQPLSAIANYASGCARRLRSAPVDGAELAEVMAQIASQALHAGKIVGEVSELVRKSKSRRSAVDVNDMLRHVLELIEFEVRRHGATVRLDLGQDLPPIMADRVQIQQVVLNLVHNGCESMLEAPDTDSQIVIRTTAAGAQAVAISVSDTGRGIDADVAHRLFEPFFTTKAKGMGMGLAISRSIIKTHRGCLTFRANPKGGTIFSFTVPVAEGGDDDRT